MPLYQHLKYLERIRLNREILQTCITMGNCFDSCWKLLDDCITNEGPAVGAPFTIEGAPAVIEENIIPEFSMSTGSTFVEHSIMFEGESESSSGSNISSLIVRPHAVYEFLRVMRMFNPHYANVTIDHSALERYMSE